MHCESIKEVFRKSRNGEVNPERQKQGAGRVAKLEVDNKGLLAAALAINVGASTQQATEICNMQNKDIGLTVSRNTLMKTIAEYTHVDVSAVHHRKTGIKDSNSDWAVARTVFSEQLEWQYDQREKIDRGEAEFDCSLPPPIWPDGIMWANKNHVQQVLGGSGHSSSFSGKQTRITMDPTTGALKRVKDGGKMPLKKLNEELDRKRKSKHYELKNYNADNPDEQKYGPTWEDELWKSTALKSTRSVHHMIDHLVAEGDRMFANTN